MHAYKYKLSSKECRINRVGKRVLFATLILDGKMKTSDHNYGMNNSKLLRCLDRKSAFLYSAHRRKIV